MTTQQHAPDAEDTATGPLSIVPTAGSSYVIFERCENGQTSVVSVFEDGSYSRWIPDDARVDADGNGERASS